MVITMKIRDILKRNISKNIEISWNKLYEISYTIISRFYLKTNVKISFPITTRWNSLLKYRNTNNVLNCFLTYYLMWIKLYWRLVFTQHINLDGYLKIIMWKRNEFKTCEYKYCGKVFYGNHFNGHKMLCHTVKTSREPD